MRGWRPALALAAGCAAQWALCVGASRLGMGPSGGFALGCAAGIWHLRPASALPWSSKALRAGLFPLSYCALAASQGIPSWAWGACAAVGALVFPRLDKASAPLWRSPSELAMGLAAAYSGEEPSPASALDAGCGLGDAVLSMRAAFPGSKVDGVESAWAPWAIARARCGEGVELGDLWEKPWGGYGLVYLFLRPEAMGRARAKCADEMEPQSVVASMDFEFEGATPWDAVEVRAGRVLRLYRVGELRRAQHEEAGGQGAH